MQPVAKRARKGRKNSASVVAAEAAMGGGEPKDAKGPDEDRLRIGTNRMLAMTHVLTHCTDASYNLLQMHLVWVGDYSLSAINDATLGLAWLWKGVPP